MGDENHRGLSGGQVKRLSIGVEIINFPDIMFLDEPTTGLDSAVSFEIIAAVRNLANQNRTVLCTIHSPSLETGSLFDKLLLMARGRVIYFGPASNVAHYFASSPFQFYFKPDSNPFDFAVAVAGSSIQSDSGEVVSSEQLIEYYSGGEDATKLLETVKEVIALDQYQNSEEIRLAGTEAEKVRTVEMAYNTSLMNQIKTLSHRSAAVLLQNKKLIFATVMRFILVAIFYGSIFLQLKKGTDTKNYYNRISIFFFSLMFLMMVHQSSIPAMLDDRLLFYRERGARAYGALPYWLSSLITQLPIVFLATLAFSLVIYWMVGFRAGAFGYFFYFTLTVSICGLFFSQFLAAVSASSQMALTLTPLFLLIFILFAGFLVYVNAFPEWLGYWGPYISFMRYAFQGLVLNEFDGNSKLPLGGFYISNLGFEDISKESCAAIMVGFMAGMGLMVFLALKFVNFEKR